MALTYTSTDGQIGQITKHVVASPSGPLDEHNNTCVYCELLHSGKCLFGCGLGNEIALGHQRTYSILGLVRTGTGECLSKQLSW